MNDSPVSSSWSLTVVCLGGGGAARYSLEEAAGIAGVHPDRARHYCRLGVFGAALAQADREPVFDDDALYELRRFEHFRRRHRVNPRTLRLLCNLWREVEQLKTELRQLRSR